MHVVRNADKHLHERLWRLAMSEHSIGHASFIKGSVTLSGVRSWYSSFVSGTPPPPPPDVREGEKGCAITHGDPHLPTHVLIVEGRDPTSSLQYHLNDTTMQIRHGAKWAGASGRLWRV